MSSTLPGGATRAASADPSTLPQRQGMRLHQLVDVSSAPTQEGDSLVFKTDSGMWEPIHLPTGPGEVVESMLADESVTTYKIAESAVTLSRMADNSVGTAELLDSAVTDAKIGTRTIGDTSLDSPTGTLGQLLSRLGTMIRNITGKPSWLTPPAIHLEALANHRGRHAVGGDDPITPLSIGAADREHVHTLASQSSSGFMSSTDKTKLDGVMSNAAAVGSSLPPLLTVGHTGNAGSSSLAARADHTHTLPGLATTSAAGFMSASDKAKIENATTLSNSTPDALSVGQAAAIGTSSSAARADHAHAMPGLASSSTAGFMSANDKSKLDSVSSGAAGLTGSPPSSLTVGTTSFVGTSSSAARADHRHALPGYATTSVGGFMSPQDKQKIDASISPRFLSVKPSTDAGLPASTQNIDIMKMTLSSSDTGYYLVTVVADLDWKETDDAAVFFGRISLTTNASSSAGTSYQPENMLFMSTSVPVRITVSHTWIVHHATPTTRYIYFNVGKTAAGTTGSSVRRLHTVMHAVRIG